MDLLIILSMEFQIHKYMKTSHFLHVYENRLTNITMVIWEAPLELCQVINLSRLSRKEGDSREGWIPWPSSM